jgi:DNA invertase Pin-like site-specific DNA recombinase
MTIAANLLTRWGRFMLDLVRTLQDLQAWHVSLVAQSGLQFDLSTSLGKLIASVMAALAEFERDLLRQRGQRIKADRVASRVLALVATGHPYRQVGRLLNISKNTVLDIVKRAA